MTSRPGNYGAFSAYIANRDAGKILVLERLAEGRTEWWGGEHTEFLYDKLEQAPPDIIRSCIDADIIYPEHSPSGCRPLCREEIEEVEAAIWRLRMRQTAA